MELVQQGTVKTDNFELELFSFITSLKKLYEYLSGAEFTWVCDC